MINWEWSLRALEIGLGVAVDGAAAILICSWRQRRERQRRLEGIMDAFLPLQVPNPKEPQDADQA